jgi:hypothetical protein
MFLAFYLVVLANTKEVPAPQGFRPFTGPQFVAMIAGRPGT